MVRGVEEIGGAEMCEEHGVHRGVGEVFIGDARHIDGEAGAGELALIYADFAGGEAYGAAVVIEEIAAGPADGALLRVHGVGARADGRLRELAGAFKRQAGGLPFGEAALEGLDLRETEGAESFRGGGGVERTFARAIDDERRGGVEGELCDVLRECGLVDARVFRASDVGGGEDFFGQDVEECGWADGFELGLEFAGGHGAEAWG